MMLKKLSVIGIIAAMGMIIWIPDPALAKDEDLVDRDPLRYSDEVKGLKPVPDRPQPLEWGQGYLKEGAYCCEFELPTGMVISPNLLIFCFCRLSTAVNLISDLCCVATLSASCYFMLFLHEWLP